jgi:hypothetical protein
MAVDNIIDCAFPLPFSCSLFCYRQHQGLVRNSPPIHKGFSAGMGKLLFLKSDKKTWLFKNAVIYYDRSFWVWALPHDCGPAERLFYFKVHSSLP